MLSAWCLGVLNRHRRLPLSYTAPVAWNAVTIVARRRLARSRIAGVNELTLGFAATVRSERRRGLGLRRCNFIDRDG